MEAFAPFLVISFLVLVGICALICVLVYFRVQKQEQVFAHGQPVMGQVQGFKYLHNRFLRRMDRCVLIVAFDCQGRTYKQKTLNTAKAFKYRKGDEVELLYHPTYKKHIVIRTEGVSGPREFGYL